MAKKALIAMSGGVDSSVAAYLATQMGYESTGITLKLFDNDNACESEEKSCCTSQDIKDAQSVCDRLGIPYYVYNFKDSFKENVISRFISAYENGRTPNPCIDCNRYIKFEKLVARAEELDYDCVVTGHYSIVEYDKGADRYLLRKSVDLTKDQSYVLYSLSQRKLSKTMLPLGGLTKEYVREIAEQQNFINARKHDSQDICFIPDGDYAKFIEQYTGKTYPNGNFVDENGAILGEHKGIIRYTVGQRKGLGLALPQPMYVKEKNLAENKVILCTNDRLFSKELYATDINLIAYDRIDKPIKIKARVRYNQSEQPALVEQIDENTLHIVFDEPQRAISKGQAVVLYDGEYVIGGGTIV